MSRSAWLLVLLIEIDNKIKVLKLHYQYKRKITYKAEGYKSQMDAICDHVFTYAFYLRNQPPPKNSPNLDSHHCALFFICLIPCMKTSISITLIICKLAQNLHINISHRNLKILSQRECFMLVVWGFQRKFFSAR